MSDLHSSRSQSDLAFERKVLKSRWALAFERLWPRLWVVIALAGLFVGVSLAGVWPMLGNTMHQVLLGLFALALLAAIVFAARVRWPHRDEAIRRIERVSGVPHRPASSYEDTFSHPAANADPATMALWNAHRQRLSKMLARLKAGRPHPHTHRFDPFALRALLLLGVVLLLAFFGDRASERLAAAFRLGQPDAIAGARLDAWITPPAYTAKPPVMLADGARKATPATVEIPAGATAVMIPQKSVLIVRISGTQRVTPALEILEEGKPSRTIGAQVPKNTPQVTGDVSELRYEVERSARIRVIGAGIEMAAWTFDVIPDQLPKIALVKPPERTPRGSMKLTYTVEDDYGVAAATAKVSKLKQMTGADPAKAWARTDVLKGPRPPLERPPVLALRVPRANAGKAEAQTHLEVGSHPWAGMRVMMVLEAKDVAGQTGRSEPMEIILPARQFQNPIARAIVEQRLKLVDDPRYRGQVLRALDALTLEPEGFIDDVQAYLGLRSAYHRLRQDRTRAGLKSVTQQLWHVALRIEDGDLSDAERALREAQEQLSKALEDGASDAEIQQLMQQLRQALNEYMEQMAKQAEGRQQMPEGLNQENQTVDRKDLDRMLKDMEEMAKNGSREKAQQMLSELRDLMERMQSGKAAAEQGERGRQMMEKMDQLGGLVGKQQKLMDDTFKEMRAEGQRGQKGAQGPQGKQGKGGQQGQRGEGKGGQQGEGQQGEGQRGEGQRGQAGRGGEPPTPGSLGQRQSELRRQLEQMQRELDELGMGNPGQLDSAREAMENAEDALKEGDMGQATSEQSRALDQMRQGAQQMAQQMMQQMPGRYGQSDTQRDPLGRPQRSEGPDLGTSVKVPDQIDIQRAREILEELRRRSGEATRPPVELDYLERLLRRF